LAVTLDLTLTSDIADTGSSLGLDPARQPQPWI